jgi:phage terminase large subunit-like protein
MNAPLLPADFPNLPVLEQVKILHALPPKYLALPEVVTLLGELDELVRANPLQAFMWHSPAQELFLRAQTALVAAFAGNRFGKTTALTIRSLIEVVDADVLPAHLRVLKRWFPGVNAPDGVFGRIVNPSLKLNETVILPSFRKWVPAAQLFGGSWAKAYAKQDSILRFRNGSFIEFMAYEQDVDKFGGAARHFVGYDEPPPRQVRDECLMRTVDYGGYEMFAMTPLKANVGWVRRDIWKKRESPDITVVKGSIHDNSTLDDKQKRIALEGLGSDLWRLAREYGDFVDIGGLIYPEFERSVVDDLAPAVVREWDIVVGIDPGVRNCGITFHGFDRDNSMWTFAEALVQDGTPTQYVQVIDQELARWGIGRDKVTFVIDPAFRQRSQVNAETVESALMRLGVYCIPGQNSVEAGVQQLRERMAHGRYKCFRSCTGLRDEADEYAAEDREDGEFKVVKTNDHRLDSLRYPAMFRPFDAVAEAKAPERNLGWKPGTALPASRLRVPSAVVGGPMGNMS